MQTLDHPHDAAGSITGSDTLNLMGQYFPRTVQGTFTEGSDCRGTGSYADSLGNCCHSLARGRGMPAAYLVAGD